MCKMIPTTIYYIVFSEEFVCWGRSKILSPRGNVRHLSTFSLKTFIDIKLRYHGNEQNECFPLAYDRWSVVSLSKYKISEPKVTYWAIPYLISITVYIVNTFMKIFFDILQSIWIIQSNHTRLHSEGCKRNNWSGKDSRNTCHSRIWYTR